MRSTRTRRIVAAVGALAVGATIAFAAVALASPASDPPPTSVVIGRGSMSTGMGFNAQPGTDTVVAQFTFPPNSSTGWHSHPGKTLVTVMSGTFTVYHDNCHAMTYEAGDAFVELPSSVHVGRNETGGTVTLTAVFFGVPKGGGVRIDHPQPAGCDKT